MEELRAEILEAERARSDLLKWKLILVAGLGAVGLGLNPDTTPVPLVLIGIPLVCGYVDLLCRHLILRVHVIGGFLRTRSRHDDGPAELAWKQALFRDYEEEALAKNAAFDFENWALVWSSAVLSIAVGGYGLFLDKEAERWPVFLSGVAGLALTLAVELMFESRKAAIGGDVGELLELWRGLPVLGGQAKPERDEHGTRHAVEPAADSRTAQEVPGLGDRERVARQPGQRHRAEHETERE